MAGYVEVENPMIMDNKWRHFERYPKVIGECAGCEENITSDQAYYEFTMSVIKNVFVHQKDACCRQYVSEMSICRGEEK